MIQPKELLQGLRKEYSWHKITIGESGAQTYYLTAVKKSSLYLKVAPIHLAANLFMESRILEWLQDKLPVPKLIAFFLEDDKEHLLMSPLKGRNMAQVVTDSNRAELVKLLAAGLQLIHRVPVTNCPFNHTIEGEITFIQERIKLNLVKESDFDKVRQGRKPGELLEELIKNIPAKQELVFTHGDYCLPNIIVSGKGKLSGFIDLSRAGIGDRYRDIALACRSIEYNFGGEWIKVFAQEYGLPALDEEKIEFYQLVDEFF